MNNVAQREFIHLMLLSSDYSGGKRVCLHFAIENGSGERPYMAISRFARNRNISLYQIVTDDDSVSSVLKKEPFFEGVKFLEGTSQEDTRIFKQIVADREANAFDVALFILSKKECTYRKILIYLYYLSCYYYLKFNKPLFKDPISCKENTIFIRSLFTRFPEYNDPDLNVLDKPSVSNDYGKPYRLLKKNAVISRLVKIYSEEEMLFIDRCLSLLFDEDIYRLVDALHEKYSPYMNVVFGDEHRNFLRNVDIRRGIGVLRKLKPYDIV